MKNLKLISLLILLLIQFKVWAKNNYSLKSDSLNKHLIGINYSLVSTPLISYDFLTPVSLKRKFVYSYKLDLSFERNLGKKFYLGVNMLYADLNFYGYDYYGLTRNSFLETKLNYKILISYLSLAKDFLITQKIIFSPAIKVGLGTNIGGYLIDSFIYHSNNNINSTKYKYKHEQNDLITYTGLQFNFSYKINDKHRVFCGILSNTYSLRMFNTEFIGKDKNIYNFNIGYKHAF